jgi:MFS superfamily sulfate permease-like transporter
VIVEENATMSAHDSGHRPSPLANLKHDLPASIVVFLVALPLCMGVAIASGAPVAAGLITGIVGGLVVGMLAGSPLQVSGPAAGLTVIVYQIIQQFGLERLGVIVLAAGAMQILAGMLRLGQWFRAVSPAVIHGMLAGIGVLIFASQFHVMVDDKPKETGLRNLLTIPEAIQKGLTFSTGGFGSSEERTQRTAQLQQLGILHLRQKELAEEIHHLLASDKVALQAEAGVQQSLPSPGDASAALPPDPRLVESLEALAPRQQALIDELTAMDPTLSGPRLQQTLDAARQAHAELAAARPQEAKAAIDTTEGMLAGLLASLKNHNLAALLGVVTIVVIVGWQSLVPRRFKVIPAPVVAVTVAALAAWQFSLPVLYVEVPSNLLDEVFLPTTAELRSLLTAGVLLAALQIAVIASAETLLCASAVDQMHNGPRTQYDRELAAQGVGNMICGLVSALPMTGVIVRSSANVNAGGKTRLSAVLHGLWILVFVAGLAFLLRLIPTSCLAAILVYTGWKLFHPKAIKELLPYGRSEVAIYLATMVMIVATDLLTGVLIGVALSVLKLLHAFTRLDIVVEGDERLHRTTLRLAGAATFLRLPKLAAALERVSPGTDLHVHLERLSYIDHACLDLLMNWEKQHEATGGTLTIDWDSLEARFGKAKARHEATDPAQAAGSNGNGNGHLPEDGPSAHDAGKPGTGATR